MLLINLLPHCPIRSIILILRFPSSKTGVFQLLNYDEGDVDMGKGATWANLLKNGAKLDSGYYMLVTGSRMASGAVLSNITFFNVKPEATTDIELVMRESKEQVQVIGNFDRNRSIVR